MEFESMILNAGLRLDYFNANAVYALIRSNQQKTLLILKENLL